MKKYKLAQNIYHRTTLSDDYISDMNYVETNLDDPGLVEDICAYFVRSSPLKFPAKSFAVAIIYAKLISKYFEEDFFDLLSDDELLYGNDKYYFPYNSSMKVRSIYDKVISFLEKQKLWDFEKNSNTNVMQTIEYFYKEFLLIQKTSDTCEGNGDK